MRNGIRHSGHRRAGRLVGAGAAIAGLLLLAGCSSSNVPRAFDLSAPSSFPARAGAVRGQLIVVEPKAIASLDTERIAVRDRAGPIPTSPTGLGRPPSRLLQARLIQAFENANRLRSVGRPGDRLASDWQLIADVRSFEVVAGGATEVVVELSVKLVNDRSGRILAGRVFTGRAPAAGIDAGNVSAAFNTAVQRVLGEIAIWATGQV